MIDIAVTLAKNKYLYSGSVSNNTEDSYNLIRWEDVRKKPTWQELNSEWLLIDSEIKKDNCKNQAKTLIANCDWSVLPDVNITNKSEFESYRSQLRNLILNPVEDPIFPIEPNPIWSN